MDSSAKSETSPKPKTTEAQREASKKSYAKNQDDQRAKKLQYKHDHIDSIREQQNLRYQQIKNQLQLKRLSHTVFSEKFTDEQRNQLLEELNQWKNNKFKIEFIIRKINILDLNKREHIAKILLAYEIDVKQTNNGVYCMMDALPDELINTIYDYLLVNLK